MNFIFKKLDQYEMVNFLTIKYQIRNFESFMIFQKGKLRDLTLSECCQWPWCLEKTCSEKFPICSRSRIFFMFHVWQGKFIKIRELIFIEFMDGQNKTSLLVLLDTFVPCCRMWIRRQTTTAELLAQLLCWFSLPLHYFLISWECTIIILGS